MAEVIASSGNPATLKVLVMDNKLAVHFKWQSQPSESDKSDADHLLRSAMAAQGFDIEQVTHLDAEPESAAAMRKFLGGGQG